MKKVIFTYDSKDMKHGINGEIGEACASILLDDDRAEEIRVAFNENRKAAAAYTMRNGQSVSAGVVSICVDAALSRAASRVYRLRTFNRRVSP